MQDKTRIQARLLFLTLLLGACARGPAVVVTVAGLPPGSVSLHPSVGVDGRPAQAMEPFTLSGDGGETSFVLRLPSGAAGLLSLGVGALDGGGCVLGTGVAEGEIAEGLELRAEIAALPAPPCGPPPKFIGVTPGRAPTEGMVPVRVRGFGLPPDTAVRFGDTASDAVTYRSAVELSALVPPRRGFGQVALRLALTDGSEIDAGTFRYFSTTLEFMSYPIDLTGNDCTAMAIGNLDGNQVPDVVIASRARRDVSVVLNDRVGPVGPPTSYAVGPQPSALAIGDLNQDERADLLVTDFSDAVVRVFWNRGGGSFRDGNVAARTDYPVDGQPSSIAVGDVNNDGRPDVVVASQATNSVDVLLNMGGALAAPVAYPLFLKPRALALADVSGDGRLDILLTSNNGTTLTVFGNAGNGTFPQELRAAYLLGDELTSLAVADLDGDSRPDAVLNNDASRSVAVLLNRGGEFPPSARSDVALDKGAVVVAIGDLNGDDQPDVVAASAQDRSVTVLQNDAGRLSRHAKEFMAGTAPVQVLVQDVDFDGRADIGVLGADRFVGLQNRSP